MMRTIVRHLVALVAVVAAALGYTSTAHAAPSPLPAGWMVFDSNRCPLPAASCVDSPNFELYVRDTGGTVARLTNDANYDSWWPKISPDRTKILFHRTDAGLREIDWQKTSTWQINVDGTGLVKLIGSAAGLAAPNQFSTPWKFQAHAEWAPVLGNAIAIIGATQAQLNAGSFQIYLLPYANNAVGTPFQVTRGAGGVGDRPGVNIDPSWSPDQSKILFVGCVLDADRTKCDTSTYSQLEVFRLDLFTGPETQLTYTFDKSLNFDPYYSPNGERIAYLHETECTRWGIKMIPAAGGPFTSWDVIEGGTQDDVQVNSKPTWSADSSTLYFHRYPTVQPMVSQVGINGTGLADLDPTGPCFNQQPSNTSSGPVPPLPPPLHTTPLPDTSIVFDSNRCPGGPPCQVEAPNSEIYRRDAGGQITQLTADPAYDSFAAKISPDRTQILFYRTNAGFRRDSLHFSLWVMNSNGSSPQMLIGSGSGTPSGNPYGWVRQAGASWAPQGNFIAMSAATAAQEAAKSPQVYLVSYTWGGLSGPPPSVGAAVRVSYGISGAADRPGANVEPSWHPDQQTLLFTGCALNAARTSCDPAYTSNEIILTASTMYFEFPPLTIAADISRPAGSKYHDASFSPDGQYVAASLQVSCSETQIHRMNGNGTGRFIVLANGNKNLHPQWSVDSSKLYFQRYPADLRPTIWQITPQPSPLAGTGLAAVTTGTPCASTFPNLVP